jgi:hypothetical protein
LLVGCSKKHDDEAGLTLALRIESALPNAEPEARHQLALNWCRRLCSEQLPESPSFDSVYTFVERLVPALWPARTPTRELVPLLESSLANNRDSFQLTAMLVKLVARDPDTAATHLWQILELIRDSKQAQYCLNELLLVLPEQTRNAFVARFADDPDPVFRCTALQQAVEREVSRDKLVPT